MNTSILSVLYTIQWVAGLYNKGRPALIIIYSNLDEKTGLQRNSSNPLLS